MNSSKDRETGGLSSGGTAWKMPPAEEAAAEFSAADLVWIQSIVDSMRGSILVVDSSLCIRAANRAFYAEFSSSPCDTVGCLVQEMVNGPCSNNPLIPALLDAAFKNNDRLEDFQVTQVRSDGVHRRLLLTTSKWIPPITSKRDTIGPEGLLLLTFQDLTKRHQSVECTHVFRELQRAYERERNIAEQFERPLLQNIREDAFAGLSLATAYEAASQEADVGGDFVDAFTLPRGLAALAIADASGKGLGAAVRALQVKNVLRAFAREYPFCPSQILSRLNDYVCDTLRFDGDKDAYYFGGFVCMSLAILDPVTGEGSLISAGCETPTILRRDGIINSIPCQGLPLGIQRETMYQMTPLQLSSGDTLLLSTDGVTEARKQGTCSFFGYDKMISLAQKLREYSSVIGMARGILEGARDFGGGVLRDDACLLIARKDD